MAAMTASDRKSTRLNSSHLAISYAVFCLKKNTDIVIRFTEALGLYSHTLHTQDDGGPFSFRRALSHPYRIDALIVQYFFLMIGRPPGSSLFPYTTLFR